MSSVRCHPQSSAIRQAYHKVSFEAPPFSLRRRAGDEVKYESPHKLEITPHFNTKAPSLSTKTLNNKPLVSS
jgi:hypothetical protein